ncbi:PAS domain S-box protein [Pseudodesulfovibrio sp.]|uniref:PAS domain S-box protein n=1 Tax=Pseudodesulfovibrio sp. TaxID=2035812 RepID=UPI00260340FF|nr:PAS domain S-box protein [Pseudodesulfovibrio sp.]MDD3312548.1 PAS domain S-box protein [Pseudodesulfovibrio sp.]
MPVEVGSLLTLLHNICLLLAAVLIFDMLSGRGKARLPALGQMVSGVGLGMIGILIMATPWSPEPGVIIDTRTVLLGLGGLFFGPGPTWVAVAMTGAYRLAIGGAGAWTGFWLILLAGGTGLAWRQVRRKPLADISRMELFLFGLVLHVELLLMVLALPPGMAEHVLRHAAAPVLLLFPACTVLMGRFLAGRLARRRMEERLHESEEMFRKTFSDHLAVQLLIDPASGDILDANMAAERFYGWSRDVLRTMRIQDINTLDEARVASMVERARTGRQTRFDFQHRLADGATRHVEVFSSRLTVRGQDILHSIIHDVTARRQVEEALHESESRLHLAVDGTGLGLWDWDIPSDGLVFNEHWAGMLGYALPALRPMHISTWRDLCHAEDMAASDASLHEHFEGKREFFEQEFRMRHRSGELLWMLVRGKVVERDAAGRPVRMIGTMEDVTERRRHREEIEREVQRRKTLMENSNDGILVIDGKHQVVETNRRFAEMLGYTEAEILGMYTWEYEAEMDEAAIRSSFADLSAVNMVVESRHRRKDGTCLDVEVSLSGSEVMGEGLVMAIVRDISERKQVQADLRREKERAEAANQSKSEFLANMSHEIRTPLGGILGMLQLLQSTSLDPEQEEYVGTAVQSSRRLNRLLTDVLDLSRVEAGKLSLQAKPFALADEVAQVCEMFHLANARQAVTLVCRVDPAIPGRLVGDSTRLVQVLVNLVGNAFKFTASGAIVLEAQGLPPAAPGSARVLFSVEDTGQGIPPEKLGALFSPFTQAHEGCTREFQGAGLGLSICKRLVALMGGSINLESEPGEGTVVFFAIDFPLPSAGRDLPPKPAQADGPIAPLDILLAEDDRVNHIATRRLLEKDGHRVVGVENGREALEALRGGDFDLVLMDIQMPLMNGMDAVRAIRRGEAGEDRRDIPVIALTAYAMAEDRDRILATGMNGYLTKPMNLRELRVILAQVKR